MTSKVCHLPDTQRDAPNSDERTDTRGEAQTHSYAERETDSERLYCVEDREKVSGAKKK